MLPAMFKMKYFMIFAFLLFMASRDIKPMNNTNVLIVHIN